MPEKIFEEMRKRGAWHCVYSLIVDGEEILTTETKLYFNSTKNFAEWYDVQRSIYGSCEITMLVAHRV